ncbi:MAG: PEP-CTERM sorting domain-containing protein [Candidatus Omnitrophica bacterium]|nr:PEP-CTERM sorting domain-containing protein [Candidatus Omnitrophota bacterium]
MVTRKITLVFTLFVITCVCVSLQAGIIDDVQVTPENPTISDSIEINVFATLPYGEVPYSTEVIIYDNKVDLDITFGGYGLPAVTSWHHTENIGTLDIGTYDLVVTTSDTTKPGWDDTYSTSFEVVPEPATLLLFGLGGILIRKK